MIIAKKHDTLYLYVIRGDKRVKTKYAETSSKTPYEVTAQLSLKNRNIKSQAFVMISWVKMINVRLYNFHHVYEKYII